MRATSSKAGNILVGFAVLLVFFLVVAKFVPDVLDYKFYGRDGGAHLLNVIKIAQSGCVWGDALAYYNDVHFTDYFRIFHYPPVPYLSSSLMCLFGLDGRLAVPLSNAIWLFLGYMSIAAACALAMGNRLASVAAALVAGIVMLSPMMRHFVQDPGWRMAAFGITGLSLWVYLKLAEHHERFWSWLLMGFALGACLLVHALPFISSSIAFVIIVISSAEMRRSAFVKLRLLWTAFGFLFVASLFYLPLALYSTSEFAKEFTREMPLTAEKILTEFSTLHWSYALYEPFFPYRTPYVGIAILVALAVGTVFGNRITRTLIAAYLLSHASLTAGIDPGQWDYLPPLVAFAVLVVSLSIYSVIDRAELLKVLAVLLVFPFVVALDKPYPAWVCEANWELELISSAIEGYDQVAQQNVCVIDCWVRMPKNRVGDYRHKAFVAVAMRRPADSTRLFPMGWNAMFRQESTALKRKKCRYLARHRTCDLLILFKPTLQRNACPILRRRGCNHFLDNFEFVRRYKLKGAWMEIYERKGER